jgi:hypothetical protein
MIRCDNGSPWSDDVLLETLLPLGKVDPGLRAPDMPLDLHSIATEARLLEEIGYDGLVVHHSDFDVLIPSHSRMGKFSGGKRISMLRGTPGRRRMKPLRSRVMIIWWTDGGLTRK